MDSSKTNAVSKRPEGNCDDEMESVDIELVVKLLSWITQIMKIGSNWKNENILVLNGWKRQLLELKLRLIDDFVAKYSFMMLPNEKRVRFLSEIV
jgi:hypothetical protein